MIVIILVALILLAYFGLNLKSIVSGEIFQDNWNFLKSLTLDIWSKYLKGPVMYVWETIFIPYVWNPIIDNITKRAGQ